MTNLREDHRGQTVVCTHSHQRFDVVCSGDRAEILDMAKDPGLLSGEPATTASQHDLLKRKEQELAQVVDEHDDLVSLRKWLE